jgi:hypothetical protein
VNHLKRHLSVANVLSCLALFMAVSGVAYAATLGKNAVKTKNIANGAVTSPKIRNGGVTAFKLANGAVISSKIAPGSVTASALATGAVRSSALGGSVVTTAKLKNDAVTGEKIANSAVTNSKLGPDAVATGKIQDGAVTAAKLSSSFYAQLLKNVSYATKESGAVSATNPQTATAECPAGKQAIGGGIRVVPGDATVVQVTESFPFLAGDGKRTGWMASAKTSEAGKTFAVEAYAVCAEF